MSDSFRRGLRLGTPYAVVALVLALSFGVLAVQAGFTPLQAIATSALVFGGPHSSPRWRSSGAAEVSEPPWVRRR